MDPHTKKGLWLILVFVVATGAAIGCVALDAPDAAVVTLVMANVVGLIMVKT